MEPLDVVSFTSGLTPSLPVQEMVGDLLCAAGCSASFIDGNGWLKAGGPQSNKMMLFVLSGSSYPYKKLITLLKDDLKGGIHSPRICLLTSDPATWKSELLDCFDEFIGWPCNQQEFAARFKRLRARIPAITSESDASLLDEFAKLNMIGNSPAFLDTIKLIKKFARCDAPILIEGETGTGKEMAARAIHYLGERHDFPFIPVNCGAIPDNLLENELFGHEKGAFTDARTAQPGIVELAHRGTLFLDEVDTLSSKAQVALLRFIQNQEYRPLGSHTIKTADVRIVTATNSNLQRITQSKHFREDLLFRLNVLAVTMPPLRERSGDVEPLALHLLRKFSCQYRQGAKSLHPETLEGMKRHAWPGNVRELENVLHREFLLSESTVIHSNIFSKNAHERRQTRRDRRAEKFIGKNFRDAKASAISEFETAYLQWLINATDGNVSEAARRSGKERRALGKLIKKYNLSP